MHIQILLYKSKRFLDKLVQGLNQVESPERLVVHFLENSDEDSKSALEKMSAGAKFKYTYDNENSNLGFGKGHNFLFNKYKHEYGEFFMLLNPDTLPFYNFLQRFEGFRKSIEKSEKTWGIIELAQFPKEHPKDYDEKTFVTDWASAAAAIYRTSIFDDLQGFDESLFMYCEDVDISWRIRERGYTIYHCPIAKVAHLTRELDKRKDPSFEEIYSKAGNLYLRHKYFPKAQVKMYRHFIKGSPYIRKIDKEYKEILERAQDKGIKGYKKFKSPKIFPDTNYSFHRW